MAKHPPSFQKYTYLVPLFQDLWPLSTTANVSCKTKKREENKTVVWPNIRGMTFLENQGHPGKPHKTYLRVNVTSVILRAGLYSSYKFNCLIVLGSKIFIQ